MKKFNSTPKEHQTSFSLLWSEFSEGTEPPHRPYLLTSLKPLVLLYNIIPASFVHWVLVPPVGAVDVVGRVSPRNESLQCPSCLYRLDRGTECAEDLQIRGNRELPGRPA